MTDITRFFVKTAPPCMRCNKTEMSILRKHMEDHPKEDYWIYRATASNSCNRCDPKGTIKRLWNFGMKYGCGGCCDPAYCHVDIPVPTHSLGLVERAIHASSVSEKGSAFRSHATFVHHLSNIDAPEVMRQAMLVWIPHAVMQFNSVVAGTSRRLRPGIVQKQECAEQDSETVQQEEVSDHNDKVEKAVVEAASEAEDSSNDGGDSSVRVNRWNRKKKVCKKDGDDLVDVPFGQLPEVDTRKGIRQKEKGKGGRASVEVDVPISSRDGRTYAYKITQEQKSKRVSTIVKSIFPENMIHEFALKNDLQPERFDKRYEAMMDHLIWERFDKRAGVAKKALVDLINSRVKSYLSQFKFDEDRISFIGSMNSAFINGADQLFSKGKQRSYYVNSVIDTVMMQFSDTYNSIHNCKSYSGKSHLFFDEILKRCPILLKFASVLAVACSIPEQAFEVNMAGKVSFPAGFAVFVDDKGTHIIAQRAQIDEVMLSFQHLGIRMIQRFCKEVKIGCKVLFLNSFVVDDEANVDQLEAGVYA